MMNIYRYKFYSHCPNNGQLIEYHLELKTTEMIQVEKIVETCAKYKMGYHETLADYLLKDFGGQQVLKAHHHGVEIETWRQSGNGCGDCAKTEDFPPQQLAFVFG